MKQQHGADSWKKYAEKIKSGELQVTDKQREARRINALRNTYNRFKKDEFETFDLYLQDINNRQSHPNLVINHKIVKIEEDGYGEVYDLTVDTYHNFALSSGIFVHNCVGYDDEKQAFLVANSWGTTWGLRGFCWMPYAYFGSSTASPSLWKKFVRIMTFNIVKASVASYVFDTWVVSETELGN